MNNLTKEEEAERAAMIAEIEAEYEAQMALDKKFREGGFANEKEEGLQQLMPFIVAYSKFVKMSESGQRKVFFNRYTLVDVAEYACDKWVYDYKRSKFGSFFLSLDDEHQTCVYRGLGLDMGKFNAFLFRKFLVFALNNNANDFFDTLPDLGKDFTGYGDAENWGMLMKYLYKNERGRALEFVYYTSVS